MGDSRSESSRGDLIIPGINSCFQSLQKKDDQTLDGGAIEDVRETLNVKKEFLIKKLFNLKMTDSGSVAGHLNEFNTLTS